MIQFSVVIPLYNKGPHVRRALDSALGQSLAPLEILVVDDNSSDDGLAIVEGYGDPRIRVLKRKNPGPGGYAARNLAIHEAKGTWIAFLDADDEWRPGHLAALDAAIATEGGSDLASDLVCAFSGYNNVYPDGRTATDPYTAKLGRAAPRRLAFVDFLATWLDLRDCPIWTSAAAFRRDTLIQCGLFPADRCRRGGDKDLWLRAMRHGSAVAVPGVDAIYHRDSVNMVTRSAKTTGRHCLCDTIVHMLTRANAQEEVLLKRLFNQEVFQYALYAAKGGRIARDAWQGFYREQDLLKFVVLNGLSTTLGGEAVRCLQKLRGRA
jgi:succinoglycan biosynthesis protein ExoO